MKPEKKMNFVRSNICQKTKMGRKNVRESGEDEIPGLTRFHLSNTFSSVVHLPRAPSFSTFLVLPAINGSLVI